MSVSVHVCVIHVCVSVCSFFFCFFLLCRGSSTVLTVPSLFVRANMKSTHFPRRCGFLILGTALAGSPIPKTLHFGAYITGSPSFEGHNGNNLCCLPGSL